MRHNVQGRKLGRTTAHRTALFRNQLASLVAHERIVTTLYKAKELRSIAERVITRGRRDSVAARRWVGQWIPDRDLVKKVFHDLAPRFVDRPGGYTRIVKLGPRLGDAAEMAALEWVVRSEKPAAEEASGAKGEKKPKKAAAKPAARPGGKKLPGRRAPAGGGKVAPRAKVAPKVRTGGKVPEGKGS